MRWNGWLLCRTMRSYKVATCAMCHYVALRRWRFAMSTIDLLRQAMTSMDFVTCYDPECGFADVVGQQPSSKNTLTSFLLLTKRYVFVIEVKVFTS